MIVIGLTGGIASGKTTITNFLKKKKIYSEEQIHNLEKFLQNPDKWND